MVGVELGELVPIGFGVFFEAGEAEAMVGEGGDDLAEGPLAFELGEVLGAGLAEVADVLRAPAAVLLGDGGKVGGVGGEADIGGVVGEGAAEGVALEAVVGSAGFKESGDDGRVGVEVLDPGECALAGVHEVSRGIEGRGGIQNVAAVPAGGGLERVGFSAGAVDHSVGDVKAVHLACAEFPKRERIESAGALEVDGAAAPDGEVAEDADLVGKEVVFSRAEEGDVSVDGALVDEGCFVPGETIGFVHLTGVVHVEV